MSTHIGTCGRHLWAAMVLGVEIASVVLNVAAGVCLLFFWYGYAFLLPFEKLRDGIWHLAVDRWWTPVNLFGVTGTVLASTGLIAFSWTTDLTAGGLIGVLLAVVGLQLLGGNLAWESLIWPVLASKQRELLRFDGPLYRSGTLAAYFAGAGVLFAGGYVTLAVSLGDIAPTWIAVGLGTGATLFAVGPLFGRFQVVMRSIGMTSLAVSQASLALV